MSHTTTRRRPLWMSELESDVYILKLNLADPTWSKVDAVMTALRPRIRLAWGIHSASMALLKIGQRLDWACPADFLEFYDDGFRTGRDRGRRDVVELPVTRETQMDGVGRLFLELGMDSSAVLAHLDLDSESAR